MNEFFNPHTKTFSNLQNFSSVYSIYSSITQFFSITLRSMNNYLDDFRMNMKYYREQAGISQTHLSVLCECGTGTIGGIEAGKAKPSFDMMIKIAEALKVNPADLFIRDSSKGKVQIRDILKKEFNSILAKI